MGPQFLAGMHEPGFHGSRRDIERHGHSGHAHLFEVEQSQRGAVRGGQGSQRGSQITRFGGRFLGLVAQSLGMARLGAAVALAPGHILRRGAGNDAQRLGQKGALVAQV